MEQEAKPYLLFCGRLHYPHGGWKDFHSAFATVEEACAVAEQLPWEKAEWWQVVDRHTLRIRAEAPMGCSEWFMYDEDAAAAPSAPEER